jgi:hypothetical protein
MTATWSRCATDSLLAELDLFTRAAKTEPADDESGGAGDAPTDADLEKLKEEILTAVREQLDWDGQGGDPNASKDALEDALADMFDADVEIIFDGKSRLTLVVDGEQPVQLTPDYLGELLEDLAKQGSGPGGQDDAEAEPVQRGHAAWQRGRNVPFDENRVNRDPGGEGGGRFIKKGTTAAGAVADAASTAGKPAGGKGGGLSPADLAGRAKDRAGPRATAKAVGGALSAGTGKRVRVSGNRDGSFNVGPEKKKLTGKQVGHILLAAWLAFGVGSVFLGGLGLPILAGTAATIAQAAIITKLVRGIRQRRQAKAQG